MLQMTQSNKENITPDNKKIRVTMIGKGIHKLVQKLPQWPNSPNLPRKSMVMQLFFF